MDTIRQDRNTALFWGFIAMCTIPAIVWATRERPIAAQNTTNLVTLVHQRESAKPSIQMRMPASGPVMSDDLVRGWREVEQDLANVLGSQKTDTILEKLRKVAPPDYKPTFARRALLSSQPVWVVECVNQRHFTPICNLVTPAELVSMRDSSRDLWFAIVPDKAPYPVLQTSFVNSEL
jgi:hypothetical protein